MTGPGILDDLTTQLTDFLGLPGDLDLPKLCHVKLQRGTQQPGWSAEAQFDRWYGPSVWECGRAWALATGSTVQIGEPHTSGGGRPWRGVSVLVSVAGLEVKVWGHVPADDPFPEWAQQPATPEAVSAR